MKSILLLLTLCFAMNSFGAQAPYLPKDEQLLEKTAIKGTSGSMAVVNSSGKLAESKIGVDRLGALRMARAEYEVDVDGGDAAAHGLGVSLPANSMILQSWFYIDEAFADGGSGTVALHCEDANNIYSAADITGISTGVITNGIQVGFDDVTTMSTGIAAECELTATVATAAQTSGKLTLFLLYSVHD